MDRRLAAVGVGLGVLGLGSTVALGGLTLAGVIRPRLGWALTVVGALITLVGLWILLRYAWRPPRRVFRVPPGFTLVEDCPIPGEGAERGYRVSLRPRRAFKAVQFRAHHAGPVTRHGIYAVWPGTDLRLPLEELPRRPDPSAPFETVLYKAEIPRTTFNHRWLFVFEVFGPEKVHLSHVEQVAVQPARAGEDRAPSKAAAQSPPSSPESSGSSSGIR